ncbi:MAG: hypothetical protein D6800_13795, partial [Candidatus Zixiibacteriota bacterium]
MDTEFDSKNPGDYRPESLVIYRLPENTLDVGSRSNLPATTTAPPSSSTLPWLYLATGRGIVGVTADREDRILLHDATAFDVTVGDGPSVVWITRREIYWSDPELTKKVQVFTTGQVPEIPAIAYFRHIDYDPVHKMYIVEAANVFDCNRVLPDLSVINCVVTFALDLNFQFMGVIADSARLYKGDRNDLLNGDIHPENSYYYGSAGRGDVDQETGLFYHPSIWSKPQRSNSLIPLSRPYNRNFAVIDPSDFSGFDSTGAFNIEPIDTFVVGSDLVAMPYLVSSTRDKFYGSGSVPTTASPSTTAPGSTYPLVSCGPAAPFDGDGLIGDPIGDQTSFVAFDPTVRSATISGSSLTDAPRFDIPGTAFSPGPSGVSPYSPGYLLIFSIEINTTGAGTYTVYFQDANGIQNPLFEYVAPAVPQTYVLNQMMLYKHPTTNPTNPVGIGIAAASPSEPVYTYRAGLAAFKTVDTDTRFSDLQGRPPWRHNSYQMAPIKPGHSDVLHYKPVVDSISDFGGWVVFVEIEATMNGITATDPYLEAWTVKAELVNDSNGDVIDQGIYRIWYNQVPYGQPNVGFISLYPGRANALGLNWSVRVTATNDYPYEDPDVTLDCEVKFAVIYMPAYDARPVLTDSAYVHTSHDGSAPCGIWAMIAPTGDPSTFETDIDKQYY